MADRATHTHAEGGQVQPVLGGDESTTTISSGAEYQSWYGNTPYTISAVAPDVEHAAVFNGAGGIRICFTCWVLEIVFDVSIQIQTQNITFAYGGRTEKPGQSPQHLSQKWLREKWIEHCPGFGTSSEGNPIGVLAIKGDVIREAG